MSYVPARTGFCGFLVALLVCAWHGHAMAQAGTQGPVVARVGAVVVEGNDKTGSDLIVAASELAPGMPVDDGTLALARQRVLNKRVFSDVRIDRVGQGAVVDVRIVVRERWTLLPIPFVSTSYGVTRGGIFLMDTNLLGRMKMLVAGVTFSTRGTSAIGFYQDPSLFGSRWAARLSGVGATLRHERYDGSRRSDAFHEDRAELAGALGYQLARDLFVYGGGFYVHAEPSASGDFPAPPRVGDVGGVSLELTLRMADYYSYFDEGLIVRAQHRQGFWGRAATQSRAYLQLATRTWGDQSASLVLQYLGATGDRFVDAHRLGGQPGARGFVPLGLWAEHIGTASVEYQVALAHLRFGTWTANAFCDAGRAVWSGERTNILTPGMGTRIYLKNVAFPAVGVDVAYAVHDRATVISGSLGLSM